MRFDAVGQRVFDTAVNTTVSDDIYNFNYKSAVGAVATLTNKTTGLVQTKTIGKLETFSTNPLYLFASIDNGTFYSWIKMYSVKITDKNKLVYNFIPVHAPFQPVRKQNCMFDKVTQKLFCNAGGGDDFLTD